MILDLFDILLYTEICLKMPLVFFASLSLSLHAHLKLFWSTHALFQIVPHVFFGNSFQSPCPPDWVQPAAPVVLGTPFVFLSWTPQLYFLILLNLSCRTAKIGSVGSNFSHLKGSLCLSHTWLIACMWSSRLKNMFQSEFWRKFCVPASSIAPKKLFWSQLFVHYQFVFLSGLISLPITSWNFMIIYLGVSPFSFLHWPLGRYCNYHAYVL